MTVLPAWMYVNKFDTEATSYTVTPHHIVPLKVPVIQFPEMRFLNELFGIFILSLTPLLPPHRVGVLVTK